MVVVVVGVDGDVEVVTTGLVVAGIDAGFKLSTLLVGAGTIIDCGLLAGTGTVELDIAASGLSVGGLGMDGIIKIGASGAKLGPETWITLSLLVPKTP